MKNRVFILSFLISMISVNFVFAQTSTKKLSYQAVVRNAANELVVNQNLAVEITVLDAENAPQYKETHLSVPTNQNGLLWLWVGEGTPTLGTMADVVWKDAVIRSVFTLPDGSTVTQNTPVTAMPYAYFADEVDTIFLQNYLDTHDVVPDNYVTHPQLNDTLDHYYTKGNVDNKLNDYEKKSELCGDVKECIKDTLGKYTTSNQIDTLLGAYFDSTHTKSVISDTATALRAMMGDAAYNSKITLKKNNVELDSFRLNQQTDKAINIPIPTTVAELSDAGNYTTNAQLNDTLSHYYTDKKINDTLSHYLTQEVQVLSVSNDTLYLTGGSWVKLPKGFSGDYNDLTNRPDLSVYTTNVHLDDTLSYYFDTTQVKTAIHDTAVAIRAAIPAQVNADWNATGGPAEILNKPDLSVYATNAHLNDTLNSFATKDTLSAYATKDTLKNFLTISGLCDSLVKCGVIKDMRDSIRDNAAAIQINATNIQTNATNIGLNKQAIIDSSAHIRNDIKNGQITIAVNRSTATTETTVTNPTFGVNQRTDQTVTINIPQETTVNNGQLTIVAAGDTTRFTANQATNDTVRLDKFATKDTLSKYTTTDNIDTIVNKHHFLTSDSALIVRMRDSIQKVNAHVSADSLVLATKIHDDSLTLATKIYGDSLTLATKIHADSVDLAKHISDSTRMVFDTLHKYYATKDTLKNFLTINGLCDSVMKCGGVKTMRDSIQKVNAHVSADSLVLATRVHDDSLALATKIHADSVDLAKHISDSTRMVFDTLHKYYATKDTLKNFVNKLAIRDSVNKVVTDSLRKGPSEMTRAIDSIARHHISDSTRMVFDTLHKYYATKDTLKNFLTINGLCDSVMKCDGVKTMRDSIQKVNAHVSADSLVLATKIHDDSLTLATKIYGDSLTLATKLHADSVDLAKHISDSTRMVFDTLHKYYATKKALKDTATAIRNDICDSATTCITKALADANSEINHAVDTIARNNIHDTAVAIRALIPTVPTNVSAFTNDAKYVNNASCDSLDFCALMAKVNALANSMGEFNNTINDMQHTIDSLEGVIDALSSLLPKVTLTTDQTTVPIGSGDVASVICTATLKNANGYTLYWNVDGTDSTSNHNTPFTVNFTTVGTHKIVCTAKQEDSPDIKDSVTITITKGTPTVNVTMPTGLVYTGAPQALITAGSTTGGTLQYKLNDGAYSTDIPEASAVGSYTVSYKVVGNDNWNDVDETSEDVTIAKMPINPTVSITGWTSCEPANIPSVTGNTGNAPVTYEYKVNGADDNTYGAAIPVSAGEYTIRATVAETANYSAGVATADFTIAAGSGCEEPSGTPATILVAPTATPGTITSGTTTPLVTEGQAENGTMMYAVTTSAQPQLSDFSTTVPTAAALTAGTCYVWYYAQGIIPYINSPIAGPIEVTVTPPPFSVGSNKKVYFAPANLQASTSDYGANWTWHFAANPWNYNGDGSVNSNDRYYHNERINGNGTVKFSGAGTVDQFGWVGASNTAWEGELGTTLNAAMYGISNSWNNSDYGNVSGESLKSDWGNTINDGYNWRTLTSAEWSYLLASRASGSTVPGKIKNSDLSYTNITVNNARYTLARINIDATPVNGMIIFPDGITIDESEITQRGYINREIGNTMYDTWEDGTKCTTEQWAALAAKGCVFLPMGGAYRYKENANTPVFQPGTSAGYWSSSPVNATQAYFVSISKSYVDPRSSDNLISNDDRRRGHMVRLVRDAE